MTYNAIIVGLGAMGSAAACHLAQRGERVLGIEQFTPAHAYGSSHGRSRIIRQAYIEDPAYVPLVLRAYELWRKLEHDSGEHLLTITGGLMIGAEASWVVQGSVRSAFEHGLEYEMLDAAEIRRRYPPLTPSDGTVALFEKQAGFLDPEKSVSAHLQQAEKHGAELHFNERVVQWRAEAGHAGVSVTTDRTTYSAGQLVISAGPWASQLLTDAGLPLAVDRQVLYWFDPIGGTTPFLPDRFPIYVWDKPEGELFYGFPAQTGAPGGVKVAFGRITRSCDPDAMDRAVSTEEIDAMRACVADCIPALNSRCIDAAACMYTSTPDHHFILSRHPNHAPVIVASPCSGHGFKFSSVIGEILADLVCDGSTRHNIHLFSARRFH